MDSNTATTHCQMRSGRLGLPRRKCHSRHGCQQHQKLTAAAPGMAGIMNPPF
jgi:hypothetical protein